MHQVLWMRQQEQNSSNLEHRLSPSLYYKWSSEASRDDKMLQLYISDHKLKGKWLACWQWQIWLAVANKLYIKLLDFYFFHCSFYNFNFTCDWFKFKREKKQVHFFASLIMNYLCDFGAVLLVNQYPFWSNCGRLLGCLAQDWPSRWSPFRSLPQGCCEAIGPRTC